jgi:hypothetical protein
MRTSLTSVKDKAVDSNDFILGDANFIDEAFHVPQATKGSHQIAVAVSPLPYITCSRSIDVELRLLENVLCSISVSDTKSLQIDAQTVTRLTPFGDPLWSSFARPSRQLRRFDFRSHSMSKCGSLYF